MSATFTHDETGHLFIAEADGHQATLSYRPIDDATIDFQSTYVPHVLRGRNVGTRLVRYALDWARDQKLQVVPSCWFVGSVVERHVEYRDVLKI